MRQICLPVFLVLVSFCAYAQQNKVDSLKKLLATEKQDTTRIVLLWKLAEQYQFFKPDSTLQLAQQAYLQAKNAGYVEGESRSLAVMATGQYLLGNYSAALKNYTLKLQIEEQRNSSRNYASALNNIGLMYNLLADYPRALMYLRKADSTVKTSSNEVKLELKNRILVNLGETFFRMGNMDSADYFFSEALYTAIDNQDQFHRGVALLGLGNLNQTIAKDSLALDYYRKAIKILNDGTNNDMLCESSLGLAKVFKKLARADSALYYGRLAFNISKKDGFLSRELDAASFLGDFFKSRTVFDSAIFYLQLSIGLQDSLKGQSKTREAMIVSSSEQLRQIELAEEKEKEAKIRIQQLQILGICIFIPFFFLITLGVSRVRIHRKIIRFMGVVSLLLFFEFLVLLLHPLIGDLTHHHKVLELLILVVIGAGLAPLHHKLEKIVLDKLTKREADKNKELESAEEPASELDPEGTSLEKDI